MHPYDARSVVCPGEAPLTIDKQLDLLASRGLLVEDRVSASRDLLNTNYYRLSGYARQFQTGPVANNQFSPGTTFDGLMVAHDRDVELSSALLDALCVVERSLRARYAHFLALELGEQAFYLEPGHYLPITPRLGTFIDKLTGELDRSKTRTVERYRQGEDFSAVPIWVAIEVVSFGSMSKMLQYLARDAPARALAASYSVPWDGFQSTVHSLAVLRNRCAHHGQLWHRRLDVQTPVQRKLRRHEPDFDPQGPYAAIIAVKRLLTSITKDDPRVSRLIAFFDDDHWTRAGFLFPAPR